MISLYDLHRAFNLLGKFRLSRACIGDGVLQHLVPLQARLDRGDFATRPVVAGIQPFEVVQRSSDLPQMRRKRAVQRGGLALRMAMEARK